MPETTPRTIKAIVYFWILFSFPSFLMVRFADTKFEKVNEYIHEKPVT